MYAKIAILVASLTVCACGKIPSTLKQCDRKAKEFPECLREAIEDAVTKSTLEIKEIGLRRMDPLDIPYMEIKASNGPASFYQIYKNLSLVGLSKVKVTKADMNFDTNVLTLEALMPLGRGDFDYEVNGKILLFPIRGKGRAFVEMEKVKLVVTYTLEEYDKKGETHFKIKGHTFLMTPELIRFHLDNLFDGDKALGDTINIILNENWSELWSDVKSSYETAFGQVIKEKSARVLAKVSKKELFGDP